MAWVSVYDSVNGSKLRELAKSMKCTKEEALGTLVSLWMWGLNNADEFGKIVGAEKDDILDAFSTKLTCRIPNVVDILIESGWIDVKDGDSLVIHDWEQWQSQWYKAIQRRKDDAKRQARRRKRLAEEATHESEVDKAEKAPENADSTEECENLSLFPQEEKKPEKTASRYSEGFEAFWKVYPRKIDKGNAYKKYTTRRKDGFSDEELLSAATAYAEECQKLHTEQAYIKHPKTFLSDSLPFTDYIKKAAPADDPPQGDANPFAEWG